MLYKKLGNTDIKVSVIGLGTMTWGEQNTEAEAHEQLDYALSRGVNLIDTAEMYPVPPNKDTQGRTETYIGTWIAQRKKRDDFFLASKIVGPTVDPKRPSYFRDGQARLDRKNIAAAIDASLKRLRTDYLDLYQLHWPDRITSTFGQLNYPWPENTTSTPIAETLDALQDLVKAGKIRHFGLSNETPWGVAQFLKHAERDGFPRPVSIQNAYNLLNRIYEIGLAEFSHHEQISLLAYSPLAMGLLTGKFDHDARPPKARLTMFWDRYVGRYGKPNTATAAAEYNALARQHGLTPTLLAQAWVNTRPFVASNLIGATTLEQLKENIDSADVKLSKELTDGIEALHLKYQNPAP